MFNKQILIFLTFLSVCFLQNISAQDCSIKVQGRVIDEGTMLPLSIVNIYVQETAQGTSTDDEGRFDLTNICAGHYHIIFSHIGCEDYKIHIDIERDTIIDVVLAHTETALSTVVIEGQNNSTAQPNLSVNRRKIEDSNNLNLSAIIENEAGVHLIKNGSGISKPVVQGLFGNRLTILNNGVAQSGQQWGNDHSPEIDPFAADKISIIKGASALEYAGGNLGSIILVEPKKITREPHLHGQVNYSYETNGRGNNLNLRLEKYSPKVAWRLNGTMRKYGDSRTADYFLNNTGLQEFNLALQLEKSWNEKLFVDFYASTFNTELGVLRGSHISNENDLLQSFASEEPFYTEPNFSYAIDAPKQRVSHQLAKLKTRYYTSEESVLEIILAGQLNDRKEFDIRRGGRSETPALSLNQFTFNADVNYSKKLTSGWNIKLGSQSVATDNTNDPDTDILPLIPDYRSWETGVFTTLGKKMSKVHFKSGVRYDYEYQQALTITRTIPKAIERFDNQFHNASGLLSADIEIAQKQSLNYSIGLSMRNPEVNELYSNGLHQGVSGIEEGDENLDSERAIKNTIEYKWVPSPSFSFGALAYHQYFDNYIFLDPQDEVRSTIRGAFPVFRYEQTDAAIYGFDITSQFTITKSIIGQVNYSYLRGDDLTNDMPLVFMPPNSLFASLSYSTNSPIKISPSLTFDDLEIEVNNRFVFEQNNLLSEQDFLAPPPAYNLVGLKLSSNVYTPNYKIRLFMKVSNLLNVRYRDYLNRQRYFADDLGVSFTFGMNFKF